MTLSDGESEWSDYESANEEGEVNTVSTPEVTKDAARPGQKKSRSAKRRHRGTSPDPDTTTTTPSSPPKQKKEKKAKIILPPAASSQPSSVTLPTYQPALATPTVCSSTAAIMEPSTPPPASPIFHPDMTVEYFIEKLGGTDTVLMDTVTLCVFYAEKCHRLFCNGPDVHTQSACEAIIETKRHLALKVRWFAQEMYLYQLWPQLTALLATDDNPEPFSYYAKNDPNSFA
jgi:hypothetical protein